MSSSLDQDEAESPTAASGGQDAVPPARPASFVVAWSLAMVVTSGVVAVGAGLLELAAGADLMNAVRTGGKAFGTTMGLCVAAVSAVAALRRLR